MIKLLSCFLILALVARIHGLDKEFVDKFMVKLQKIGAKCALEVDATANDIAELISQKIPPSTHQAKCMIFCVQKSFNIMKEDGTIDQIGAIQALNPLKEADPELHGKVLSMFISCGLDAVIDKDPCETATGLAVCGKSKVKELGFALGNFMV